MSETITSNPNSSALIELGRQATEIVARLRQIQRDPPRTQPNMIYGKSKNLIRFAIV
jgi:hypothetical protein